MAAMTADLWVAMMVGWKAGRWVVHLVDERVLSWAASWAASKVVS